MSSEENLRVAQKYFTELKDACMNPTTVYFSVSNKTNIEKTCRKVNEFCSILRNIKLESGKKWPQLCKKFKMKARFCPDSKCEIILQNDGKLRYIVPFLYTYLEKVGIMQYHLHNNEYISGLGLGLTNCSNYNVALTDKQKEHSSVLLTKAILTSKAPLLITTEEELDIYLDIQQKAENARFLRKMNEFYCFRDRKRTSTESGVGHEKSRFIINEFIYVMDIITEKTRQDAFVKALNDVHDKLCNGDVVYREPSHVLLPEEEYPVSIVEFEEMYDLMKVYDKDIQHSKTVYAMIQDVMSCMRDTGMIDSYLRLVFTRGLGAGMIANKLISNTIRSNTTRRDDYETRIGKLLFIKERIDIITSLIYKRDPLHEEKDNERYGDMSDMLSRIEPALKNLKVRFDKKHEKEKAAAEKL